LAVEDISWGTGLKIKVVPVPGSSRQVIEMVKKNLKELLETKLCGKRLEFRASVSELYSYPEIEKTKHFFAYKTEGVFMIGFDVENEIHRINSILQSKKIEDTVRTDSYLSPMLR